MKIRLWIYTGVGAHRYEGFKEIPDEDWRNMEGSDRSTLLREMADDFLSNHIDYGATTIKDDE
jgi:hypothetical protein